MSDITLDSIQHLFGADPLVRRLHIVIPRDKTKTLTYRELVKSGVDHQSVVPVELFEWWSDNQLDVLDAMGFQLNKPIATSGIAIESYQDGCAIVLIGTIDFSRCTANNANGISIDSERDLICTLRLLGIVDYNKFSDVDISLQDFTTLGAYDLRRKVFLADVLPRNAPQGAANLLADKKKGKKKDKDRDEYVSPDIGSKALAVRRAAQKCI